MQSSLIFVTRFLQSLLCPSSGGLGKDSWFPPLWAGSCGELAAWRLLPPPGFAGDSLWGRCFPPVLLCLAQL